MKWALALLLVAQIVSTWGGKRYRGKMIDLNMWQSIDPYYGQMMGPGDVQIKGPRDEWRMDPDDERLMDLKEELEKLTEDFNCLKEDIENCKNEKTILSDKISQLLTKLAHSK